MPHSGKFSWAICKWWSHGRWKRILLWKVQRKCKATDTLLYAYKHSVFMIDLPDLCYCDLHRGLPCTFRHRDLFVYFKSCMKLGLNKFTAVLSSQLFTADLFYCCVYLILQMNSMRNAQSCTLFPPSLLHCSVFSLFSENHDKKTAHQIIATGIGHPVEEVLVWLGGWQSDQIWWLIPSTFQFLLFFYLLFIYFFCLLFFAFASGYFTFKNMKYGTFAEVRIWFLVWWQK